MISPSRILPVLAAFFCLFAALSNGTWGAEGVWSKHAVLIPPGTAFRIPSPDRTKTAFTEGTTLTVIDGGQRCTGLEGYSLLGRAELTWSQDSTAFAVTASEGGTDGPWFVTIFKVKDAQVTLSEPFDEMIGKMHDRFPCLGKADPNFGAVWWLKGAAQLLVAAELPVASSCSGKERVRGYLIDSSTGKIQYEFDDQRFKEEFSEHLGERLLRRSRP